ncbi:MAG: hypothetical protein ACRD8A_16645 [Candidatus Acidiferrales bacterium]
MIVLWFLLIAVVLFTMWQVLARRLENRSADGVLYWVEEFSLSGKEDDLLSFDLLGRIFSSEDYLLVKTETSTRFLHWFDHERKALALDWLAGVQTYVRKIISEHRRAAAQSRGLKPAKELELAFEFLVFQVIGVSLYCVILIHGPANLSTVVETFLSITEKLRKLLESAVPAPSPAMGAVED